MIDAVQIRAIAADLVWAAKIVNNLDYGSAQMTQADIRTLENVRATLVDIARRTATVEVRNSPPA